MSVAYNKFNAFIADVMNKVHNLGADTLSVALSNSAPSSGNSILSDITEIAYTNLSSRTLTVGSSTQTSGTHHLAVSDKVLTASGGAVPTFRYIVVYNTTPTNKNLIAWFDYGSAVTLQDGDSITLDIPTDLFTAS